MMNFIYLLSAMFAVMVLPFANIAQANDLEALLDLPAGHALLSVDATEMVEVEQDLLMARLEIEAENESSQALQNKINTLMAKAVETAKKVDGVKVSTQRYHVYQIDRSQGRETRRDMAWRGQQTLALQSLDKDAVLELVADLQELGLTTKSLSFTVSPALYEETKNDLLEKALEKLTTRAMRAANALGKDSAELVMINVEPSGQVNRPIVRAMGMAKMEMASDVAAPVAEAGESKISLTVNAHALIK